MIEIVKVVKVEPLGDHRLRASAEAARGIGLREEERLSLRAGKGA
jgi:hypothetical protein